MMTWESTTDVIYEDNHLLVKPVNMPVQRIQ